MIQKSCQYDLINCYSSQFFSIKLEIKNQKLFIELIIDQIFVMFTRLIFFEFKILNSNYGKFKRFLF